jgi:hypothetical protein
MAGPGAMAIRITTDHFLLDGQGPAITAAVAAGAITTGEGADLNAIVAGFVKAVETSDVEARVHLTRPKQPAANARRPEPHKRRKRTALTRASIRGRSVVFADRLAGFRQNFFRIFDVFQTNVRVFSGLRQLALNGRDSLLDLAG